MPQDTTTYDLLIVGPVDTEKCFVYIKSAIERFNTGVGKEKRITIIGQELKRIIYAESGGKGETLIQKQISEKFDMVTAILWNVDDSLAAVPYLSTAKVIELALKSDKQIFAYVLDEKAAMSEINLRDLGSIRTFQKQYLENSGISFTVKDEHELEEQFLNDLQLFFSNSDKNQKSIPDCDSVNDELLFSQVGLYFLPYGCIGRDNKIKMLEKLLENNRPVVIRGVAGVGKTTLCSYYYQLHNKGAYKFSMPFVNLENCISKADFIHAICAALQIKEAFMSLANVLEQIHSTKKHYDAFFFDNWEDFQDKTIGNEDFRCVCEFVNTLVCNGYKVLISSQAKAPMGWNDFLVDILDPDDGRQLFTELLERRGKYINQMPEVEKSAFEFLLEKMENHPLTMVLTSSLIEDPNDTLERIKNKWSEVCAQTEPKRHQSMKIALKMSYDAIVKTPGAVMLWGLIAGLSVNFSTYFIKALKQISPEISWDDAQRTLSSRSLVQFSENGAGLHMLMPVKAQWERLAGKEKKQECYALWAELIGYVTRKVDSSEYMHDAELSGSIRGVVLECMRSFMMITEFLIQDGQIEAAEQCINAMQDYYESFSDSAFAFLENLPLEKFSLVTKGMVIKCKGDICRLGRKEEPNIAEDYYKEALDCFEKCGENVWLVQVMNVIGKNKFWSFHDAEKALDWLEKSEKLAKDESYTRGIAEAKKDQAIILTEEYKSYKIAQEYLKDANSLYSELGDYRGIAHTLKRQGVIMEKSGDICKAVKKYEEALGFYEGAHYIQGQGDTLSRICNAYIELGEEDKLQENIVRGERLMDKIPYQMIKNDLADTIEKGRNWLQDRSESR